MQGWITLHRQMMEWEWYTDPNTMRVFIHCLLRANHQCAKWRGKVIARGTFLSSFDILANELNLSRQQIRTSINKLKSTNELTTKSSAQSTVFKVEKYDSYQPSNQPINYVATNEQPTDNQRITTNNNDNNENKSNMSDSSESEPPKKADKVPYQKIADMYKSILVDTGEPGMSLIDMQVLTTKRKAAIKKYWTREGKHGLERVEGYFNWLWNNRGDHSWIFGTQGKWKADLEYLLREDTIAKAREQRLGNFGGNQQ